MVDRDGLSVWLGLVLFVFELEGRGRFGGAGDWAAKVCSLDHMAYYTKFPRMQLYGFSERVHAIDTSGKKRVKLENPISELLWAIQKKTEVTQRMDRLQCLLFLLQGSERANMRLVRRGYV